MAGAATASDKAFLSILQRAFLEAAIACFLVSGALADDASHAVSQLASPARTRSQCEQGSGGKSSSAASDGAHARVLMEENFDACRQSGSLADKLLQLDKVHLAAGFGPDGSNAIRVSYVGCEKGSERVVLRFPLGAHVHSATLSFDVCFEDDFQWVLGGKLHGLGPAEPITGGHARKPSSWSARAVFRPEGSVATYIYDQDPAKKYGVGKRAESSVFQKGRWHHVELHVHLNNPGQADGCMRISVDGRTAVEQDSAEFRGTGGSETEIQTFLFSTFHGGDAPKYTPSDPNGKPATVHALFDNFRIVEAP